MKSISFFIAQRYLRQSAHETTIGTMVRICFLSIALGTFSLALITAIMQGFEFSIHEKIKSIHPQLIIRKTTDALNAPAIRKMLENEFPSIIAISPNMIEHAMIQSDQNLPPSVIQLRGIEPVNEEKASTLHKKLLPIKGVQPSLNTVVKNNQIIIGKTLAQNINTTIGDVIHLYFIDDLPSSRKKVSLNSHEAIIGGIFDTGIDEFDSSLAFGSLPFIQSLFPESGVSSINLRVSEDKDLSELMYQLTKRLELVDIVSWEELYPALVSALKLEKYAMFFILMLITLVASMNMISLLFMQITQKRGDIAILKAMGMSDSNITKIFLWLGMTIAALASVAGLLGALIASWLLEKYPFIQLPDVYYVSHLPAKMNWQILIITFIAVMILSFIAILIPTRRIKQINIAEILRFEG